MGGVRRLWEVTIVLGGCLAVAACGSSKISTKQTSKVDPKYGVVASPRVVESGKKIPLGGGRYMVGKPYTIAGKRYYPRLEKNYVRTGMASWYGAAFHGRKTANGEIYDMRSLTAAHPTMPLPSYARVTNLKNGRSIIVRVNDRGPFHGGRVIDLSKRVAELLDTKRSGVARVKVRYIGKARLDGRDHRYLVASYRGPGNAAKRTMIARAPVKPPAAIGEKRRRPAVATRRKPHVRVATYDRDDRVGSWTRPEAISDPKPRFSFSAVKRVVAPSEAPPMISEGPPATGEPMVLFEPSAAKPRYAPRRRKSPFVSSLTADDRISAAFEAIDDLSRSPSD